MWKLSDFDYVLPKELIAQYPLKERDQARLLVLNRANKVIQHRIFKDVAESLTPGDLLVLNDTKVLPCRLIGRRATGGKVDVLLLERKEGLTFSVLLKPARLKIKEKINFNGGSVCAEVVSGNEINFHAKGIEEIYNIGVMPLPPYIKRVPAESDKSDYQTVYARNDGAIASPTAGLHFTAGLMSELEAKGINFSYVTLHVGPGTFRPVKAGDIRQHEMEPEYFRIPEVSAREIAEARKRKERIIAVGTTSLRALETYASGEREGRTGLFIYPGFEFKIAGGLLTNFHLPRTTLFMLVCAFAGRELAFQAYAEAIEEKYRFYSYGDAMLIV